MMNNLEKKTVSFGKPLNKRDVDSFLSFLSDNVSYSMSNFGNILKGIKMPVQNECTGTMAFQEIKINYILVIHVDDSIRHVQFAYPSLTDKEIIKSAEEKVAEFFLKYPVSTS
jgi:hypothetical protein